MGMGVGVLLQYLMEDATVGFLGIKVGIHQNNTVSPVSNQRYLLSSLSHGELPIFGILFQKKVLWKIEKLERFYPSPKSNKVNR